MKVIRLNLAEELHVNNKFVFLSKSCSTEWWNNRAKIITETYWQLFNKKIPVYCNYNTLIYYLVQQHLILIKLLQNESKIMCTFYMPSSPKVYFPCDIFQLHEKSRAWWDNKNEYTPTVGHSSLRDGLNSPIY
jgi:hypothetical protein